MLFLECFFFFYLDYYILHSLVKYIFNIIIEINLGILICDEKNALLDNGFKCYKGKHMIYVILSVINVILLIIITYSSVCLCFARNENRSVSTIRHLIINPLQALFFSRTSFSTFNALIEIKDYKTLFSYILVLGSFFIFFFFLIEDLYVSTSEIERTFYLNSSLVFLNSCIFLLLGNIFQKKNIYGLFGGFTVSSFISVFVVLSVSKNFKKISLKTQISKYSDTTLYFQLHLILHSIKDKNSNRVEMMKFIKFNEFSINDTQNFWIEQKKEYSLLLKIESMLKKIINDRPNSILLRIGMYKLLYYYLGKYKAAYILLFHLYEDICEKNIHASLGEKFYVFRIKKVIEEKGLENVMDKTEISTRYQINKFIGKISKAAESYYSFWTLLLNASQNKDIQRLNEMGYNIGRLVNDINEQFDKITTMKIKDKKIYALYGYYLREILNENGEEDLEEILKGLSGNVTSIFNGINLNDIHTSSNFHFILVSAKNSNFGVIEKISPEISKILRYESDELIGQKMDVFLPYFLVEEHTNYLQKYFEMNSNLNYNFLKKSSFNLCSKEKFLETIALIITIHIDEDSFPFIFAQINEEEQLNVYKENSTTCYILTDNYFIIKNFTSNSIQLLNLHTNVLDDFTEITPFIKEFNEDIHFHISKRNFDNTDINFNSIKENVIKNNFINNEERIINWSINNQFFKVTIHEIKFSNKLVGYIFKFQKSNSKNQRSSILHQGRNSITSVQSKKILDNESEDKNIINSELVDLVSSSYVPNNLEKFEFDIKKKEFALINEKNEKNEDFEEVENYFQKNYFEIQNEIANLNEEVEEENEDEDDEDENDESIDNNKLYIKEEKEELPIFKKLSKNNPSINSNVKNNEYLYYNINLKNITLFVYNFKNKIVDECKGYINDCKVEEIFRNERLITNAKQTKAFEKEFKKDSKNNLNQTKENNSNNDEKKKEINSNKRKRSFETKQTLSKNIISLIGIILLNLLGLTFFLFFLFYNILETHNEIMKIIEIKKSISDLMVNSNNAFFNSYQIIALQRKIYYHYNPPKENLETLYSDNLLSIYNQILGFLKLIISFHSSMKNSNQEKVDTFTVNFCSLSSISLTTNCTDGYLLHLLEEFSYSIFSFYCINKNELDFTNIYFNFIFHNYENLLFTNLEEFNEFYSDEYNIRKRNSEKMLVILIICLVILELVILFGFIKVNINVRKEEDKVFEIFFRINPQYIINAINRCEKFIELNNVIESDPKNLVSNPVINITKEPNEEETIIESENSSLMQYDLNQVQNNGEKNASKMKLLEKQMLEYDFISKFIFLFIMILIGFLLIHYFVKSQYTLILKYQALYLNILSQYSYFSKLYNYFRTYLIFSNYRNNDPKIVKIYNTLHTELMQTYEKNEEYYVQIMTGANGLNEKGKNLIKNYYNDVLCEHFSDYALKYNKTCKEVADNIGNYGLWSIFNHGIQLLCFLIIQIDTVLYEGELKGYYYNEILYDSSIVNPLYPDNENLYEDYLKYNPFNVINSNTSLNLTVLIENIMKPAINSLREEITQIMYDISDVIEKYSVICCIILSFILIVNYISLFIPKIMKTNSQIYQGKVMLKIIPKQERDKIKKTLMRNNSI